jgi:hypothetical protein
VVGLLLGSWVVRLRHEAALPALTLAPRVIDLTGRRHSDREPVRAMFTLPNPSRVPITVTQIVPTCTCTTVRPEGQPEPPFTLAPGESTKIGLTTNPATRYGPQS